MYIITHNKTQPYIFEKEFILFTKFISSELNKQKTKQKKTATKTNNKHKYKANNYFLR